MVRHGNVEGCADHVLCAGCAADATAVLRAAEGRVDNQRLAQPVAQRLQRIKCGFVDQQFAAAATGDLGWREVGPSVGSRP